MLRRGQDFLARALDVVAPIAIALLSVLWWTITFYPGFMSYDTIDQYRQVVGAQALSDGHPLIILYLWRFANLFVAGPGALLLVHQAMLWSGLVLFAFAVARQWRARTAIVALLGWWPPLAIHSVHLWKDQAVVAGLTLAVGALLHYQVKPRWALFVVIVLALFYGASARHNAILAALPIVVLFAAAMPWRLPIREKRVGRFIVTARTLSTGAMALILLFAMGVGNAAINATGRHLKLLGTI